MSRQPPWRLPLWGGRRPGVPRSEWRWGGDGGEEEQTAAEHPAPPEGGPGEEPRLGEPRGSGARGAELQEGNLMVPVWMLERPVSVHDFIKSMETSYFAPWNKFKSLETSLVRVRKPQFELAWRKRKEADGHLSRDLSFPLVFRWTTAARCGCGAAPWRWRPRRRSCSTGCWGSRSCGREACVRPPSSRPCPRTPKSTAASSRARATAWAAAPHRSTCCSGNEARRAPGFTGLWVLTCWALQSGEDGRVRAKNTLETSVWFKVGVVPASARFDETLIVACSQTSDDSICVHSWITSQCVRCVSPPFMRAYINFI